MYFVLVCRLIEVSVRIMFGVHGEIEYICGVDRKVTSPILHVQPKSPKEVKTRREYMLANDVP